MKKSALIAGVSIVIVLMVVINIPLGPLPPLARLLNPTQGVWVPPIPKNSTVVSEFNLTQNDSTANVIVYREPDGFTGIASNHTWALFYEQGYLEAQYRLEQLTILERTANGNLASVVGPSAISSDTLSRLLMDCQVAHEEVSNLSKNSFTYKAGSEFIQGINDYVNNLNYANYPILFKLLDFKPTDWNLTDLFSLMQYFLWVNSNGNFDPILFNYALQQMPTSVIEALYPEYPAGVQNPIVPYSVNPSIYTKQGDVNNLSFYKPFVNLSKTASLVIPNVATVFDSPQQISQIISDATGQDLNLSLSLKDFGSNDWAIRTEVNGSYVALLANDPHLTTTVPSVWMGFQLVSPGMNVVGVSFPGFPGIILGHNSNVAWGATNGQIQEVYFYNETVNPSNHLEYMSDGHWTKFQVFNETINVKGSVPTKLMVKLANNGVVIENAPNVIAMNWTGFIPTDELAFFLRIDRTNSVIGFEQNETEFFKVGIQNWAVADSKGNIGIFSLGYVPIISRGNPRAVLPGNGSYNWVGFVNTSLLPHVYDPARGFVFSANQVSVSENYSYYLGWDYESGYRADEIYQLLNTTSGIDTSKMEKIQLTVHDYTTNLFLKPLLSALKSYGFSGTPEYTSLSTWNGDASINSTAETIYYFWLTNYVNDTFRPYLEHYGITLAEGLNSTAFYMGSDATYHGPLIEDLENWTSNAPNISWFNNPLNGQHRNATTVMLLSYNQTISQLTRSTGVYSTKWAWGNFHKRYLSSLFGVSVMNTKEIPAAGDSNTINAAYGLISNFGPSWRMVVNMSHPASSVGIYPGGISENPLSQYYSNTFIPWNNGVYYLLIPKDAPKQFFYQYESGVSP
ncbi:MAG: penicillin acylase family protein [Thermoplasmatales archaeon]|nr:penicillin acylase family protein [Thermoplasmatales archaeon]MCW6169933.1 penicillin acylase family protein [Thermoplasmatales archaeon]